MKKKLEIQHIASKYHEDKMKIIKREFYYAKSSR